MSLRPNVLAAKTRLAKGHEDFRRRHQAGCRGRGIVRLASNLRDAVLLDLVDAALADLGEAGPKGLLAEIALVAHGGYGRRDVAPYSDVDLMILHRRGAAARVAPLAERLLRDVFDVGLILGHSVRTPWQACQLACRDAMICTSLVESRLLAGSPAVFDRFMRRLPPARALRAGPAHGRHRAVAAARSGSATARRSSCWSRTSSARRARSATSSCSAGSASPATARAIPRDLHELGALERGRPGGRRNGPTSSCSGCATSCTSTPGRPTTC